MIKKWNQFRQFLEVDLWRVKLKSLPVKKRILYAQLRLWSIAIREFITDKCAEKASALTYFSMLSIVPVIAMLFAIAKGFGLEKILKNELSRYLSGQEDVLEYVLPYAQNMLDGANGGVITGISLIFLIYAVLRLLTNIEHAFNDIWHVGQSRKWERKISDYVAVMLLGPILLILSSSLTVFVTSQIQALTTQLELMDNLKSGIFFLISLLPYTLVWLLLFLLYLIFPNTRVKFVPALVAGVIAGTLYQLTQWGFINFQFAFSRYNAIYGSLALLPLFLIWSQLSWLIVLFGAEIAYAAQHIDTWEGESEKLKISLGHRKKLVVLLLYRIVKKFERKEGNMKMEELAGCVNVPSKYIEDICQELERAGLISKIECEEVAYQPAFDIHQMDLHTVLKQYESIGMSDFDARKSEAFISIEGSLADIEKKWSKSQENKLLIDL